MDKNETLDKNCVIGTDTFVILNMDLSHNFQAGLIIYIPYLIYLPT